MLLLLYLYITVILLYVNIIIRAKNNNIAFY